MSSMNSAANAPINSLLVAYDFTEASRKALHHGLQIARHYRAKFYLVHVVSSVGYDISGPESLHLASEAASRDAHELEIQLLNSGALVGLNYEFILREGNIWEQLSHVMETKHVEAVVVGTHGRNGLGRLVLGSVAEQIFRSADCLVLTVGPSSPKVSRVEKQDVTRPFLLASDFGAASLGALPQAASLANHFGAKLIVLHVFPACPVPGTFHWSTAGDLVHMQEQAERAGRRQFEELILPRVPAGTDIEFLARFGVVSDQILLACRHLKADLLVVGLNHSEHIETASHLPWATAHKIVCAASCPVLTVKSPRTQSAGVQRSLATQLDRRPP